MAGAGLIGGGVGPARSLGRETLTASSRLGSMAARMLAQRVRRRHDRDEGRDTMSNQPASIEGAYQEISKRYPRTVQSRDGKDIQLRLMGSDDRDRMVAFARALPSQDLLFLRRDITRAGVVNEWIRDIDAHRTFSVLAFDGEQLIGDASLHHNLLTWSRHRGEVRLVIGSEGRGHGVGRLLAEELNAIGRLLGLEMLTAQVPFDQQTAMTVFRQLGYEREAVLADYVIASDGITRDLLVATYRL